MIRRLLFLFSLFIITSVWSQNNCPENSGFFDTVQTTPDNPITVNFDLTNYFSDSDGDALTFTAESSDSNVAIVSLSDANLSISTGSEGFGFVSVIASDGDQSCFTSAEISVVVEVPIDVTLPEDLTPPTDDPNNPSESDPNTTDGTGSETDQTDATNPDVTNPSDDITLPDTDFGTAPSANCPVATGELGAYEQDLSQSLALEFELTDYFTDPSGNGLSFTYDLFGEAVIEVSLEGSKLSVQSTGSAGFVTLFINADNGEQGCFSSTTLNVYMIDSSDTSNPDISIEDLIPDTSTPPQDVFDPANCPEVIGELGSYEQTIDTPFSLEFNLNDYFSEPDNKELTYSTDLYGDDVIAISLEESVLKVDGIGKAGFATLFVDASNGNEGCFSSTSLNVFFTDPSDTNAPDISIEDLIPDIPDVTNPDFGLGDTGVDFTQCPFVTTGLEPIITSPDAPKEEVYDLKFFFSDPNDKELSYSINNPNPSVVSAELEGSVLKINTLDVSGEAFIEIQATNGEPGCETFMGIFVLVANAEEIPTISELEESFDFTTEIDQNLCPELSTPFEPISVPFGEAQEFKFDLNDYFSDPEGDSFEFEIFNANPTVAYTSLIGSNLTISLGNEYGLGFVIINTIGGGTNCINSAEILLEVVPDDSLLTNCPPLLATSPEIALQLDQPETSVDLQDFLNTADNQVYTISLLGTENDFIQADLFGSTLVVSVKEIGAGSSAVYIELKEENSGCIEVIPFYIAIEDPLGLQDINCPNLKLDFPGLITLEKGASISFAYADYFANIDTEGIKFIGAVAFENLAMASIDNGTLTLTAKDQVGYVPGAIGVKDGFGLCEIYIPFEIQILGDGITENSCPELIDAIPILEINETASEITVDLNSYFQDPDGDALTYGAFIDSNEFVDFNLIDNQLTLFLKQNIPATAFLEISATDAFIDCFTTTAVEIKVGSAEEISTNNCPEISGSVAGVTFGQDEILKNISIDGLFSDPDGDPLLISVSSSNPEIINAELLDDTITLFATPGKSGSAQLNIVAQDDDPYCQTIFNVTVDVPSFEPVVQNTCPQIDSGIPPIRVALNSSDKLILLPNLISDDDPNQISFSVTSYNKSVVDASIEGNYLVLNFSEVNLGQAQVGINIYDNGSGCVEYLEFQVEVFDEVENLPPYFEVQSFTVKENDSDESITSFDKFIGKIIAIDPEGGNVNLSVSSGNPSLFDLREDELYLIGVLDYEEQDVHTIEIVASDGEKSTSYAYNIFVENVANASIQREFTLQVYDIDNESTTSKSEAYKRFLNPALQQTRKGVGKWKVRKKITGGADADKFKIQKASEQKSGDIVEDQLIFRTNPDFENPTDANGDNIYEVDVEIINERDGESLIPVIVSQNAIVVPENEPKALQIESIPATVLQDTDNDGIQDLIDNSPLQYNPGQEDSDGDGIGDVSDDADQDGVWDPFDICPDTPFGTPVNLEGCPILVIPPNNFTISKSEKCIGENEITLTVADASYFYLLDLTGPKSSNKTLRNANSTSFKDLPGGEYRLCITINNVDEDEFQRCFDITIVEPEPLSVSSKRTTSKQRVAFDLSGGTVYNVTHNGMTQQTTENSVAIDLLKGLNTIRIDTGTECQGVFEQHYFNSSVVMLAPNPAKEFTSIFVGGDDPQVNIAVYNSLGGVLYQTKVRVPQDRRITLPTASLPIGSYYVKVEGTTTRKNITLIKE